jgi:hypothetical protein
MLHLCRCYTFANATSKGGFAHYLSGERNRQIKMIGIKDREDSVLESDYLGVNGGSSRASSHERQL